MQRLFTDLMCKDNDSIYFLNGFLLCYFESFIISESEAKDNINSFVNEFIKIRNANTLTLYS